MLQHMFVLQTQRVFHVGLAWDTHNHSRWEDCLIKAYTELCCHISVWT